MDGRVCSLQETLQASAEKAEGSQDDVDGQDGSSAAPHRMSILPAYSAPPAAPRQHSDCLRGLTDAGTCVPGHGSVQLASPSRLCG